MSEGRQPRPIAEDPCYGTYHRSDCGWPGWTCLSTVGYSDPVLAWIHLRETNRLEGGTLWPGSDRIRAAWREHHVDAPPGLRATCEAWLLDMDETEALFADGLDAALIGMLTIKGHPSLACYDYAAVIAVHEAMGMTHAEAIEYVEFNVVDAYVGKGTPAFLIRPWDGD